MIWREMIIFAGDQVDNYTVDGKVDRDRFEKDVVKNYGLTPEEATKLVDEVLK